MRSIYGALAWEFWKSGRGGFAIALCAMIGIPSLMPSLLLLQGMSPDAARELLTPGHDGFFLVILSVLVLICVLAVARVQSDERGAFPKRWYTVPVSMGHIAAWKLMLSAAVSALLWVSTACAMWLLWGVEWPPGPAASFALLTSAVVAIGWATSGSQLLFITANALLAGGFVSSIAIEAKVLRPLIGLSPMPSEVWLGSFVAFAAICAAGFIAVAFDRCGIRLSLPSLSVSLPAHSIASDHVRPQPSPSAAQFWFEWRQKGWLMPTTMVIVLLGAFAVGGASVMNSQDASEMALVVALYAPLLLTPVSITFGNVRGSARGSRRGMDVFRATLPLSDRQLAGAVLRMGSASMLTVWLMAFAGALAAVLWIKAGMKLDWIVDRTLSGWPWLSLAYVESWVAMGLIVSVVLTGRPIIALWAALAFATLIVLPRILIAVFNQRELTVAFMFLYGVGLLCATASVYLAARNRGLLRWWEPWLALQAWILLCGGIALARGSSTHASFEEFAILTLLWGALALPFAPWAAAPLALAWNRHR